MDVEFLAENFDNIFPLLTRALSTNPPLPVLLNFLIEARSDGLFLSATDLEQGIQCSIPAKIINEGSITVPGKQFAETITSIGRGKVRITQEKDELLVITEDGNKITFQTIAKEEFPTLFEERGEKIVEMSSQDVKKTFSRLVFAASTEDSRPELTGILFIQKEGDTHFVATDGFRLSLFVKKGQGGSKEAIIPSKLVTELLSIKGEGTITMYIYEKGNQVLFQTQNVTIVGRLISGEFPNYGRVIPKSHKTKVILDKEEFLQKARLASVFARENANIIKIKIEGGKMGITAKSAGVGEGDVIIDVNQEGEDNEIAFNVKFVLDFLKNIEGKTINMELSSPIEPALFTTDDDPNFLHVIMPVRVQE